MTRDKALAVFDALVVRGYNPTLSAFHGVTVDEGPSPTHEPIYKVQFGPHNRSRSAFARRDMDAFALIADEHGVKPELFGEDGAGWYGSFAE